MIRVWIGTALLAGSWLAGLGYYRPANWPAWVVTIVAGTLLMARAVDRRPARRQLGAGLLMFLLAFWVMPLPY